MAAGARAASQLAVDGGAPVRKQPLAGKNWVPQYYDDQELGRLEEVLESRNPFRWANPLDRSKVAMFENECAARIQTRHALAVTSGTAALHTAMAALEVGPGDEVYPAGMNLVFLLQHRHSGRRAAGLREIDESFNIDPADIEHRMSPQTKVIMAVHLQGNPADMDRILAIARKHGIKVLEDCSQSLGASYKGRPLGSLGDGMFSLQQSKTITAGEGGVVVTNDPYLFERAFRFHDITVRRDFTDQTAFLAGPELPQNEFTGGVLLAQVRKLDRIIADVRRNARRVYTGIRDVPGIHLRHLPDPEGELGSGVFLGFKTREERQRYGYAMRAEGVPVAGPAGSVVLSVVPEIEQRVTVAPGWPSFASARGKSIRYGRECCPRTCTSSAASPVS